MGKQTCLKGRKSKIRKFLGSFRCRKSANCLRVPVRKSQILKFVRLIHKSQIPTECYTSSPEIANQQICKINPQIANSYRMLHTQLEKLSFKQCFFFNKIIYVIFVRRKVYTVHIFGLVEVLSPQIKKKIGSGNRKSA